MIVYANSFSLMPDEGVRTVIQEIAAWVGRNKKTFVDPDHLELGIKEFRMSDGATLSSIATLSEAGAPDFPYLFCAKFMHPDMSVSGRRWITEVGLRQDKDNDVIHCSVLLQTDEISARVNAPILVTRPGIVKSLVEKCGPVDGTPSQSVIQLTEKNATAFAYEIERAARSYPLILMSNAPGEPAPVNANRLRQLMLGLAQVIEIPEDADTFAIESEIGRKYSAFAGAINIIFPYQKTNSGGVCGTIRLRAEDLDRLKAEGAQIESEILSIVSHRTNLPNSWKHVSSERVRQQILRRRLQKSLEQETGNDNASIYEELLAEAAASMDDSFRNVATLQEAIELAEGNLIQAQAEVESLKHALSGASAGAEVDADTLSQSIVPLRKLVDTALRGKMTLEVALDLVSRLFPDRLVVLESAYAAAKESDRGGFLHAERAFDLLTKLCTTYYDCLNQGQGDQQARTVFGRNEFAAKEAGSLSNEGRERRKFTYHGKSIFMEKHLKFGVKDSVAETLRVHFEWFGDRKQIVIGHCGKHLNF